MSPAINEAIAIPNNIRTTFCNDISPTFLVCMCSGHRPNDGHRTISREHLELSAWRRFGDLQAICAFLSLVIVRRIGAGVGATSIATESSSMPRRRIERRRIGTFRNTHEPDSCFSGCYVIHARPHNAHRQPDRAESHTWGLRGAPQLLRPR
jgi:hypothetical protein